MDAKAKKIFHSTNADGHAIFAQVDVQFGIDEKEENKSQTSHLICIHNKTNKQTVQLAAVLFRKFPSQRMIYKSIKLL